MLTTATAGSTARRAKPRVAAGRKWPPLPVMLVILSFIVPTELSLDLAGLRLSVYRVLFLVLLPGALWRLATLPDLRLRGFDHAMVALALWQMFVYAYHDPASGFVYGGSLALETLGAYLIARAYIRDLDTFVAAVRALMLSIIIAGLFALLDTLTGRYFIHSILLSTVGGSPVPDTGTRMGLQRAASTFDHPIHYGVYCASLLALAWQAEQDRTRRTIRTAMIGFATLLAMSSAPLLSIALQSLMLTWERWTRGFALRTHLTLAIIAGLYIGVSFVTSRGPLQLLITSMTFDPWTGIYRLLIWEHGLTNVWESPWTGIGLADWSRPDWMASSTIDAYWLVLPMRSGIPALLILVLAIILMVRAVVKRSVASRDRLRRQLAKGWVISLIALCLLGATVHFWNVTHAMLFFYLGLGGALADPKRARKKKPQRLMSADVPAPIAGQPLVGSWQPA